MRNKVIVVLALILITGSISAQGVNLGVKAGFTGTTLNGDGTSYKDLTTNFGGGYLVGAFLRMFPTKHFFIQPEVNFATKKSTLQSTVKNLNTTDIQGDIKMSNLEVPVMFGYRILGTTKMGLNIVAGPVASFTTAMTSGGQDVTSAFKHATISGQAGLSLDVLCFLVEARYEFGKTASSADVTTPTVSSGNIRNNTIVLTVGFKFF